MEFILNNKKYSIINEELFINYLMIDSYFKDHSKYVYNIHFDFLDSILKKDKITFDDILEGTKVLEDLIEKGEINFIPAGIRIDENGDGSFKISYFDLEFENIKVGEAVSLLIAFSSLLNAKPQVSLFQIKEELDNLLEKFRTY